MTNYFGDTCRNDTICVQLTSTVCNCGIKNAVALPNFYEV